MSKHIYHDARTMICDRIRYRRRLLSRLRRWYYFRRDARTLLRLARECHHP